jgi:hypothetical protein
MFVFNSKKDSMIFIKRLNAQYQIMQHISLILILLFVTLMVRNFLNCRELFSLELKQIYFVVFILSNMGLKDGIYEWNFL